MRRPALSTGISAIVFGLLAATSASAVPTTFVSANGSDTGNCTIAAPCATFAFALTRTNANGIINVLSSGSYGPLVINKSVSIIAVGVEARIEGTLTCSGNGVVVAVPSSICVNAAASTVVTIRGLQIDPGPSSASNRTQGITLVKAGALHVRNTVIQGGFAAIGLTPLSAAGVFVSDSIFRANSNGFGMRVENSDVRTTFNRIQLKENTHGFDLLAPPSTTIEGLLRDSYIANQSACMDAASSGGEVRMMIDRTTMNCAVGIRTFSNGITLRIGNSTVSSNNVGLEIMGGAILSYGTNKISGNLFDGDAPGSVAPR